MANHFEWTGLEELKEALRNLPTVLSEDASTIITDKANEAADEIRDVYLVHQDTGDLADHVTVKVTKSQFGTIAEVKSNGKIAWLFDNGSQARHYVTARGATHPTGMMWGKTPAPHTFVNTMSTERAAMYELLADLLRREGLIVEGLNG